MVSLAETAFQKPISMTYVPPAISPLALRQQAEDALSRQKIAVATEATLTRANHELQVTRVELELQNEHLKKALAELEEARLRYEDLFDYAPVGFVALDLHGNLIDANLTAILYMGLEKSALVAKQDFADFISPDDLEQWDNCLNTLRSGGQRATCELTLRSESGNTTRVAARLSGTPTLPEMPVRVALIEMETGTI